MRRTFQLLDEPWLPTETVVGGFREVSLLESFTEAGELRRIVHPSPLVTLALYRLLFAIFHRAVPITGDNEWEYAWDDAEAHLHVGGYLETWRHRFDLFDDEAPFWQVPDLTAELGTMSWAKLAAELNDNNNKVLFDHTRTRTGQPLATPAEVARLLVTCQMLSVGAGNSPVGYNVNAVLATSLLVIPEAGNLRDTLLANAQSKRSEDDLPIWEQPVPRTADIAAANEKPVTLFPYVGLTRQMTWLTRAIRIEPPDDSGCVSSIVFGAGLRPDVPDGHRDPWVAYRESQGSWVPQRLRPGRAVWRDLDAIALHTDPDKFQIAPVLAGLGQLKGSDRPLPASWTLLIGGQAADKAKLENWGQERWQFPEVALRDRHAASVIVAATAEMEAVGRELRGHLRGLASELLTTGADRRPDPKAVDALEDGLPGMAMYWSRLEQAFAGFLRALGDVEMSQEGAPDSAQRNWHQAISDSVGAAATAVRSVLGRDARGLRAWAIVGPKIARLGHRYRRMATEEEGGSV